MIAIVTILVNKRTGILSAVALGLSTKGYQLQSQEIAEARPGLERIRLFLKCPDKSAEQVEKEVSSLGPDITVENVELKNTPAPLTVGKKTEKEVLQEIARAFPDVAAIVLTYGKSLGAETRSESLLALGNKIGRATYKRDFALGSPLKVPAAWRRMIAPAVGNFGEIKADDESITLLNSPFIPSNPASANCCEFVTGFIQGLLDAGPYTKGTNVCEVKCKSKGAPECTFVIDK
jgi:predicted hydrocarbon binding protein